MAQITTIDVVWSMYGSYNDGMKRIMDTAIEKGIIEDSLAVKGCKVKFGVAGFIGDGISISVALYEGDSDAFGRAVSRAIGGYIGSYILGGWLAAQGAKVNPWLGVVGGALGVGAGSLVGATSGEMAWDMLTDEQKDKLLAVVNLQVHCNKSGDPIPNPHESPGYDDNYKNYFNCKQLAKEYSNTGYIRPSHDPIALDLDGDGVEFVKSGAYFDYDGNKFAERATWLGKDDGWLTRDVNGDGAINDGTELFGDSMKKKDGTLAKNGFDALAEFDDNKDGVIDDKDAVYSQLRVWQDANGNGISDAGELKTLAEVGIKQLNLNKTDVTGAEQANGESVRQQGSFVWNSGVIGQMNGYVVNRNVVNSKELEILPVPDDIKTLPDVRGWGNVHSLQQAIVRDASGELKKLVTAFINTTGKTEREDFANQIILKWCGVENIDPKTRGPEMDARKLAALEKLFAEGFWSKVSGHGANPHAEQVAELNKIYDSLIDNLYCELLVKSTALQFIIQPTVDASGKTTGYNLDYAKQMLDGIIAIDQNAGLELLGNYCRVVKTYGYMDNTYADHQKYLDFYNNYSAKGGDYEEALVKFSKDAITGGIGADNLTGTSGNDKIFGLAGDDAIDGGLGNDTIYGGEGNDWIVSGSGDDYAEGGAGNDVIYGGAGNDALKGGDGGDWIEAGIGSDYIEGGAGNDSLYGYAYQSNAPEPLDDFGGGDTLEGGTGDDKLNGGYGRDIYIFNRGDGKDEITEVYHQNQGVDNDVIQFGAGITKDDLEFVRQANGDLLITIKGTEDQITVKRFAQDAGARIEQIVFADGSKITAVELYEYGRVLRGAEGKDILNGFDTTDDIIYGFAGDDTIQGLAGNDKIFGGEGNDWIVSGSGDDYAEGGAGNDVIYGGAGNDALKGGDGGDWIEAGIGSDYIEGGAGNDSLYGYAYQSNAPEPLDDFGGGDTLEGGTGDDKLNGGYGRDIYIFNRGDGKDEITEVYHQNQGVDNDVIQFGAGITKADLEFNRQANGDLLITIKGTEDSITVKRHFIDTGAQIEQILFSDGSKLDKAYIAANYLNRIAGTDGVDNLAGIGNDLLIGGKGNDTLSGGAGNDVYRFAVGDGQDTISDTGGNDTAAFGATDLQLMMNRLNDDLVLSTSGATDQVTVKDWYKNDNSKVETIEAGNGKHILSTQIDSLMAAMVQLQAQKGMSWNELINSAPNETQTVLHQFWTEKK